MLTKIHSSRTADIANVIQASFPEVPCHVGVSSGQPVETSPTIQPSLNNEVSGIQAYFWKSIIHTFFKAKCNEIIAE